MEHQGNTKLPGHLVNNEGIYYVRGPDITISNPNNMDSGLTSITITSRQVTGMDFDVPDGTHILSQMISLKPHGMVFDKHLLVKFPIDQNRYKSDQTVCLMYSDGSNGDGMEMKWVNISQHTTAIHKDEMFWFVHDGYCYLYTRHFSHIFLLQTADAVSPQHGIFLMVSLYAKYVKRKLVITVGFHCHRCFENLLEAKGSFGTLLGSTFHCVYDVQGPVKLQITVDNNNDWQSLNPEKSQMINVDQLLPLCHLGDIYNKVIEFSTTREVNAYREVKIDVEVLQDKNKSTISATRFLKDISETSTKDVETMTDFQHKTASSSDSVELLQPKFADMIVSTSAVISKPDVIEKPHTGIMESVGTSVAGMSDSGDLHMHTGEFNNGQYNLKTVDDKSLTGENTMQTTSVSTPLETSSSNYEVSGEPFLHPTPDYINDGQASKVHALQEHRVAVVPESHSQISNIHPHVLKRNQAYEQIRGLNTGAAGFNPVYQNINYVINYNLMNKALDPQLPDTACVFNQSVVSEQEKLCYLIDKECTKGQLTEIAKAVGDTNGTVDMKNIAAFALLQVWKVHVNEGKYTWRQFYDLLVKLGCQSAAQQLKVVCDKDSLVRGLSKLKQDISLDTDLCGNLLEQDVINLAEYEEIQLMKSPLEKISFLVLELLVKKPGNYSRVKGFFKALHSMRYYSEYIRDFMLCPEDILN